MRSVVVVLPASMCAMIPMLRVLASWAALAITYSSSFGSACGFRGSPGLPPAAGADERLSPAVVREGLVRLGHLVRVLAPLHGGTEAVARIEQLVHEALGHRLLAAGPAVLDQPAQAERGAPRRTDLDRDLVGRATDTAAADLEGRLDVVHRALERDDRVGAALLAAALQGGVHDALGQLTLAAHEDLVHQLGDQGRVVHRV